MAIIIRGIDGTTVYLLKFHFTEEWREKD